GKPDGTRGSPRYKRSRPSGLYTYLVKGGPTYDRKEKGMHALREAFGHIHMRRLQGERSGGGARGKEESGEAGERSFRGGQGQAHPETQGRLIPGKRRFHLGRRASGILKAIPFPIFRAHVCMCCSW